MSYLLMLIRLGYSKGIQIFLQCCMALDFFLCAFDFSLCGSDLISSPSTLRIFQLLQILAVRRSQLAATGKTEIPIPQAPPPHPGYAPNAAFHAIKRHALEVINQRDAVVSLLCLFCGVLVSGTRESSQLWCLYYRKIISFMIFFCLPFEWSVGNCCFSVDSVESFFN